MMGVVCVSEGMNDMGMIEIFMVGQIGLQWYYFINSGAGEIGF